MKKAVLIIDMPESCNECPLMFRHEEERCCMPEGRNSFSKKPSWCPLKTARVVDTRQFHKVLTLVAKNIIIISINKVIHQKGKKYELFYCRFTCWA